MSIGDLSHDDCPNCHQRFEIVLLKFKLAGPQMISACPNCAMIQDNDPKRASRLGELWKREHLLLNRKGTLKEWFSFLISAGLLIKLG